MITELAEMMVERIEAYKSANKNLPGRILVYRDGVSEVLELSSFTKVAYQSYIVGSIFDSRPRRNARDEVGFQEIRHTSEALHPQTHYRDLWATTSYSILPY